MGGGSSILGIPGSKVQFLGGKVQFWDFQVQVTNPCMNHQKFNFRGERLLLGIPSLNHQFLDEQSQPNIIVICGVPGANNQLLDEPPQVKLLGGKIQVHCVIQAIAG